MWDFADRLAQLQAEGKLREPAALDLVDPTDLGLVRIRGRIARVFCGNDYLGLRHHPLVLEAAAQALCRYGAGSGAARQVAGDWPPLRELESAVAAWLGTESALLFSSGYLANLGAIPALAGEGDVVFSDERNHASLIDGCRLSRARIVVFRHADTEDLERKLRAHAGARRLVVSESVFGMDGDLTPLAKMEKLRASQDFALYLDEAHSLGVMPIQAAGAAFRMGTLSKALGSQGAFVAGTRETIALLRNHARSYLFDTALSPASSAAAHAAISLVQTQPQIGEALHLRVVQLRDLLQSAVPGYKKTDLTPIFPLRLGQTHAALAATDWLLERGVYVQAIRPPTVPEGSSRLRVTVSAAHSPEQIERLAQLLMELRQQFPWS